MKKLSFKEIFIPTIALFIICLVVSALLGFTNELTSAPIAEVQKQASDEAMQSVCPYAESFSEASSEGTAKVYFANGEDDSVLGFAVKTSVKGYGGDIEVMVGITTDMTVSGVEILSLSETPGLGYNSTKESFRNEFLQPVPDGGFVVTKDGDGGEGGRIDALTGATITSKAVTQAVNDAVSAVKSLNTQGGED